MSRHTIGSCSAQPASPALALVLILTLLVAPLLTIPAPPTVAAPAPADERLLPRPEASAPSSFGNSANATGTSSFGNVSTAPPPAAPPTEAAFVRHFSLDVPVPVRPHDTS